MNKKREVSELFPEHTVVTPGDEGISFAPEEDGLTFYENSLIKARALYRVVGRPVIADDSGICVDALGGAPGIYSSRYAGPGRLRGRGSPVTQDEQNALLVRQTNDALASGSLPPGPYPNGPRSCRYVCAMVLYLGPDRLYVFQETMEGALVDRIEDARGTGGFGYDPLFYLPQYGRTAAELTAEQKNAISHRGKASRLLREVAGRIPELRLPDN